MTKQKYELINNQRNNSLKRSSLAISLLILLCIFVFTSIFFFWNEVYNNKQLNIPQKTNNNIPTNFLYKRLEQLSHFYKKKQKHKNNNNISDNSASASDTEKVVLSPSKFGNFIYSKEVEKHVKQHSKKLICYYTTPPLSQELDAKRDKEERLKRTRRRRSGSDSEKWLKIKDINANLCTHLNIGIIDVKNSSLDIDEDLIDAFRESNLLKTRNDKLKILLWVGGGDESYGFPEMISTHENRKKFIQSLKSVLEKFSLDGVDLDFEFPNGSNSQRIHFMQLIHEIRREYQREHATYILSIAVAAPPVFVDMCYDVRMINENVDYVNIMTYDYHFYSRQTPFTGLNAPLYARSNEIGIFETLNINYSVNYWMSKGLDRSKIIIGLPTYGHSYRLVNPFNTNIGAPAEDYGSVGVLGYVTYSEICWFQKTNFNVRIEYDTETCSPWLHTGLEWISYDDERSIECKANYVKSNHFGGAMIFSLNTDDFQLKCSDKISNGVFNESNDGKIENQDFPLLRKIHTILFDN